MYGVTFYAGGTQTAVGTVSIAQGRFDVDIKGVHAWVLGAGCVIEGGEVVFEYLEEQANTPVEVDVAIDDGAVSGTYVLGDGSIAGTLEGALDNRVREESHTL